MDFFQFVGFDNYSCKIDAMGRWRVVVCLRDHLGLAMGGRNMAWNVVNQWRRARGFKGFKIGFAGIGTFGSRDDGQQLLLEWPGVAEVDGTASSSRWSLECREIM